jgi:carboxymethylenebutenolidase
MTKQNLIGIAVILLIAAGVYFMQKSRPNEVPNSEMLSKPGQAEVSISHVNYFQNFYGHFAKPKLPGNYPGVVMIHEWWGLNDNIIDTAEQLAAEGYLVLAVDLFGKVAANADEARAQVGTLNQDTALNNLKAAIAYLRSQGATKIASLGWCFGGGQSMQLALSGQQLDATVIYYGNLVTDEGRLNIISWPVLGIFGDKDTSIPVATVQQFDAALDKLGVKNEINIYPGVGHAFANPSGMNYAANETRDAWSKTLAFLSTNLK